MANPKIKIKRSSVVGKVPHYPTTLDLGEFAINTADGKVFIAAGVAGVGVGTTVREVGLSTENVVSQSLRVDGNTDLNGNLDLSGYFDVDGHANLDNVSVAGITTFGGAVTGSGGFIGNLTGNVTGNISGEITADTIVSTGIVTGTAFYTGAEGSAIRITGNTISGPATLTIDPSAVGDNTGSVVIAGNLQVDGTTTTINSTVVNIDDKNIQVATGAANDAAADGAGITIDSGDGDKSWQFEATGDNFGSSENINVASSKVYKINNTTVLGADGLGAGIINSSLTSLGTIGSLVATTADINAGTIDNSVIGGSTPNAGTFTNVTANGVLDVDGHTNLDNVSISGVTTTTGAITASGGVVGDVTGNVTGDLTGTADLATSVTVTANDSENNSLFPVFVDGASGTQGVETDSGFTYNPSQGNLSATTFTGNLVGNVTGNVTGNTSGTAGGLTGTPDVTVRNITGVAATFTGDVTIGGVLTYEDVTNIDSIGIVTARTDITAGRNLRVAGIATVVGDVHVNGKLYDGDDAFGTSGQVLSSDGTDTAWVNSGSLTAGAASLVGVTAVSDNSTHFLAFVDSSSGNEAIKVDTGLTYNPSTNQLVLAGLTFPVADGGADQVLTTDGSGTLSFQTVASGGAGAATSISQSTATATAGQTAFTAPNVFDDGAQAKIFPVSVFVNGVRHRVGSASSCDFQLSAPQTINFNAQSAATAGDRVTIQVGFGHTLTEEYFTATQDQVSFQTTSSTPGAIKEKIHVYLNGVLLRRGTDYTAGSPITLVSGADVGDEISLVSSAGEDMFTATEGQTLFTPSDNDTTPDNIEVYQNGIRLELTQDYTKGSPQVTIINPATGLDAGDELDVVITR
tara:strand:+ start:648 stop:3221 length:2574 start_codon:yes stop_codon:yes gene_type:complete